MGAMRQVRTECRRGKSGRARCAKRLNEGKKAATSERLKNDEEKKGRSDLPRTEGRKRRKQVSEGEET